MYICTMIENVEEEVWEPGYAPGIVVAPQLGSTFLILVDAFSTDKSLLESIQKDSTGTHHNHLWYTFP